MKPYRAIATDDHLMEPGDGYTARIPSKWGEQIPHVRDAGDGTDAWYVFGKLFSSLIGFSFVQGVTANRGVVTPWADVPKCASVPGERVRVMDAEHVGDEIQRAPGLANVTWLSDFPHPTSTYPTSWEYIDCSLVDCTPEEKHMILDDTPRRLYHLPEGD